MTVSFPAVSLTMISQVKNPRASPGKAACVATVPLVVTASGVSDGPKLGFRSLSSS